MRHIGSSAGTRRRQHRDGLTILDRARPTAAYTAVERTYTDPDPQRGTQAITAYTLDTALVTRRDRIITNVEGLRSDYDGMQFSVNKRMSNRWQRLAGLSVQTHKGCSPDGPFPDTGSDSDFNNPNFQLNRNDSAIF